MKPVDECRNFSILYQTEEAAHQNSSAVTASLKVTRLKSSCIYIVYSIYTEENILFISLWTLAEVHAVFIRRLAICGGRFLYNASLSTGLDASEVARQSVIIVVCQLAPQTQEKRSLIEVTGALNFFFLNFLTKDPFQPICLLLSARWNWGMSPRSLELKWNAS